MGDSALDMMTRRQFWKRMLAITLGASAVTIGLITAYLLALMQLPAAQWWGFGEIVAGLFVVLCAATTRVNRMLFAHVLDHLGAAEQGQATPDTLRAAFRSLSRMPYGMFFSGLGWWTLGGLLVAMGMWLRYDSFQLFSVAIMTLAAASGGFVSSTFLYFVHKRVYRDLLRKLADGIDDPEERRALVRPVPLRLKLMFSVTGVTFVTVTFAMCLAFVVSSRQLEEHTSRMQARFLESHQSAFAAAAEVPDEVRDSGRTLLVASQVLVVDPSIPASLVAASEVLSTEEVDAILSGGGSGDGTGFDSPNVFAWVRLPGGSRVAVAVLPWSAIAQDTGGLQLIFLSMLLFCGGISLALSYSLAQDVGDATSELRDEVERMASGNLKHRRVLESDDELGDLARSFEVTAASLRRTVGRVAAAADRAEGRVGEIRSASQHVSAAATEQGSGVREAARLMESVEKQIDGVSASAQSLNLLVEEASSSILEMGTAGEQLNDTAGVLGSQIDDVSSSIEEMVRSVKEVVNMTETVSEAAQDTSSSMEEMASAMRQVDTIAEQTAQLSLKVVSTAESGRNKVRETMEGMQSIREATETAEGVIRNLGNRALEIGAILDVIDDVADETNLLALNAAIIAAQAGEHGRAFSVVADEIKELADRVLASTKEIGGLIRAVQDESKSAVGAIEQGSSSVASGVELSRDAAASLDEINEFSRESGARMQEIVHAVREQTKAAGHVVELMERVKHGVDGIQRATTEQDRGNESVFRSAVAMSEMAGQLRSTTTEQARGGARIRESTDGVREAVEAINAALQAQSASNRELAAFLEQVASGAAANAEAAQRMEESTEALSNEALGLREDVQQFEL